MAKIYKVAYFEKDFVPIEKANLSIASSAVLYGLSVYTVFPVTKTPQGLLAFRLEDHWERLVNSSKIIGIDLEHEHWNLQSFTEIVKKLIAKNKVDENVFVRATFHVNELVPGTKSRKLHTTLSVFIYEAKPIVPQDGARLKTSVWRRIPDQSIPSRAKVNGAYVNSVLAKQDAIDSGYDDCIFLDAAGHVCELSAANIFLVRGGKLITPDNTSDLLEGINRRSVIELAKENGIEVTERTVDFTELYIADEVFACGTSAFVAPVTEIDARQIGNGKAGELTMKLRKLWQDAQSGKTNQSWTTKIN